MPDAISNPTGNFLAPFRANSGHLLQPFGVLRDDFDRFRTKVFDQSTRQRAQYLLPVRWRENDECLPRNGGVWGAP